MMASQAMGTSLFSPAVRRLMEATAPYAFLRINSSTSGWASAISAPSNSPLPLDPQLECQRSQLRTTLILTAILSWPTPVQSDVYIALQVPDGSLFFLQQDGSLTPAMRPLV